MFGDVAQLVRALRSHRRGRGFEPLHPHHEKALFVGQTNKAFFKSGVSRAMGCASRVKCRETPVGAGGTIHSSLWGNTILHSGKLDIVYESPEPSLRIAPALLTG